MTEELASPLIDELDSPKQDSTRIVKDLLAGTCGGIAQVLVGQPFDTTKVRLQTSQIETTAGRVIGDLLKNEGIGGFYKGTLTPLVGVGVCVSLQFGVNEAMKRVFSDINGPGSNHLSLVQYYVCGLAGGFTNSFVASPIEHVRIRLQTQTGDVSNAEFKGPLDCIRKLRSAGQLMRGLTPTMARESHGCGVYFLTYEALVSQQVKSGIDRVDIPAWKLCLFGATSGTMLWLMVYPLDVIKSVMQTDNVKAPKNPGGIFSVGKNILAKQGMAGFFKGFGPTMMRAAPANAATFATFETAMRLLG